MFGEHGNNLEHNHVAVSIRGIGIVPQSRDGVAHLVCGAITIEVTNHCRCKARDVEVCPNGECSGTQYKLLCTRSGKPHDQSTTKRVALGIGEGSMVYHTLTNGHVVGRCVIEGCVEDDKRENRWRNR